MTDSDYSNYTVSILKKMLRDRKLKVSGVKNELIDRLNNCDKINTIINTDNNTSNNKTTTDKNNNVKDDIKKANNKKTNNKKVNNKKTKHDKVNNKKTAIDNPTNNNVTNNKSITKKTGIKKTNNKKTSNKKVNNKKTPKDNTTNDNTIDKKTKPDTNKKTKNNKTKDKMFKICFKSIMGIKTTIKVTEHNTMGELKDMLRHEIEGGSMKITIYKKYNDIKDINDYKNGYGYKKYDDGSIDVPMLNRHLKLTLKELDITSNTTLNYKTKLT